MHIPDGYLSPQTCAVGFAVVIPVWATAARRVTAVVKTRNVPMLAVFSALSFLVMMFNVPIPDGTTAHAVGGSIIAICLGPWAAVIAVSVALAFQALLFGVATIVPPSFGNSSSGQHRGQPGRIIILHIRQNRRLFFSFKSWAVNFEIATP